MRTVAGTGRVVVDGGRPARRPPSTTSYRSVRVRDVAAKPLSVGFTHGTPSEANWLHTGGASRLSTATRAWNVVAFDLFGTAYVNVPLALAGTTAMRFSVARPTAAKMLTRDATPAPACVTRPARRFVPATLRPVRVRPPGAIAAGEATVPAGLTWPFPACQGVQNATHAPWTTEPNTPFSVKSALRNFAPNVAPPCATGMSGGGRQK